MENNGYKVTINFIKGISEKDIAEREDKIISLLVRNAIKLHQKKNNNVNENIPLQKPAIL